METVLAVEDGSYVFDVCHPFRYTIGNLRTAGIKGAEHKQRGLVVGTGGALPLLLVGQAHLVPNAG